MHKELVKPEETLKVLELQRKGGIRDADKFGVDEIDKYLRFKRGNLMFVLGRDNVGKTHGFLYLMLLDTIANGTKWLVYSSENDVVGLVRKLMQFYTNKKIHKIDDPEFYKAKSFIDGHFQFLDDQKLHTYKSLLEVAQEIKDTAYDFDAIMIDPYNSLMIDKELMRGIGKHDYDYQATAELRVFCKSNNIFTAVLMHPATESLRKKHLTGEFEGHPSPPNKYDVEGGGKFANRADEFIVFHRYIQHNTLFTETRISVEKIKETETGGHPTTAEEPIILTATKGALGFKIGTRDLIHGELPRHKPTPQMFPPISQGEFKPPQLERFPEVIPDSFEENPPF
jgi:archaellum biogenesis ATPase FlaH